MPNEINDWDVAEAGNNDPSPNGAPEGMNPSGVNDTIRENMAVLSRWQKDTNGSTASTGSSNAYAVAANRTLTAYYDGLEIWFEANHANTGAATLNVDGVAAATIKKLNDQDLASGDIEIGQKVGVIYDGTNWQMISQLGQFALADNSVTTDKIQDGAVTVEKLESDAKPYDVAFIAGFDNTATVEDLVVQSYAQLVMTRAGSFIGESGYIDTVATGAAVIVDIEKNGTSIYTTKPQFAVSTNTLTAGTLKTDGTEDFASGDRITFKVTQIGSTVAGQGVRFTAKGEVT